MNQTLARTIFYFCVLKYFPCTLQAQTWNWWNRRERNLRQSSKDVVTVNLHRKFPRPEKRTAHVLKGDWDDTRLLYKADITDISILNETSLGWFAKASTGKQRTALSCKYILTLNCELFKRLKSLHYNSLGWKIYFLISQLPESEDFDPLLCGD